MSLKGHGFKKKSINCNHIYLRTTIERNVIALFHRNTDFTEMSNTHKVF